MRGSRCDRNARVVARVICWKVGSEWANLMRVLWPGFGRKIYYFAFGANLDETVLAIRRIKVFEAFDFVLQDAALRFTTGGFYEQQGYASADAADGEKTSDLALNAAKCSSR